MENKELVWNGGAVVDLGDGKTLDFDGVIALLLSFLTKLFSKYLPEDIK